MNFIFPDTPEAIAATEPLPDLGWVFSLVGLVVFFFAIIFLAIRGVSTFAGKVTSILILIFSALSMVGGIVYSSMVRPAIIAEAEANSPQPVSVTAIFQQAAEDTYGLTLTEQNTIDLLTREGFYTLERHQLEGDMRDGEAGQVWRAGKIEIAPDGQYQALQLIWVDDEWLIIDITDPNQAGIQELPRITAEEN